MCRYVPQYTPQKGVKKGLFWDPQIQTPPPDPGTPDPDPGTPIWTRFGPILDPPKPLKSAQFRLLSMLLHMYNMYLYTPYNIYICIICVNMWNMGYEGYPMAGLGVVMAADGPHIT